MGRRLSLAVLLLATFSSWSSPSHAHEHRAPRGGTLVELGDEVAHVEIVFDASTGKLSAFVLDTEVERPLRLRQPSLAIVVDPGSAGGSARGGFELELPAVANVLTGETAGDSSEFAASDTRLAGATALNGRIVRIEVLGQVFENARFAWPATPAPEEHVP